LYRQALTGTRGLENEVALQNRRRRRFGMERARQDKAQQKSVKKGKETHYRPSVRL
jgi:hypothetical protein